MAKHFLQTPSLITKRYSTLLCLVFRAHPDRYLLQRKARASANAKRDGQHVHPRKQPTPFQASSASIVSCPIRSSPSLMPLGNTG